MQRAVAVTAKGNTMSRDKQNVMAMVALTRPMLPNPERLIKRLDARIGTQGDTTYEASETSIIIPVAGGALIIALIDAPYPRDDWMSLASRNWHWPDAAQAYDAQTAHLVISCGWAEDTPFDAHLKHAEVIAEIVDQLDAVSVFWASAMTEPASVAVQLEDYRQNGAVPTMLWLLYQITPQGPNQTVISTLGMDQFGLMELEANPASLPPQDAWNVLQGLAAYLIVNGPVVNDGDTIGQDAKHKIVVRHQPSFRDGPGMVYALDFGLPPAIKPEPNSESGGFMKRIFGRAPKVR